MPSKRLSRAVIPLVTLVVAACGFIGEAQDDRDLAGKVDSLEERVAELEAESNSSVDLEVGDSSFSVVRLDLGSVAVSLDKVAESPDGARVTLSIGNLTAASIEGLEAEVSWSRPATPGQRSDQPPATVGKLVLAKSVPAGRWTTATITLPQVTASQVGSVHLSDLSYANIILR